MKMIIVAVDEGTEFDNMPEALQKAILAANVQWCESRMVGTKPVAGRVLVLALTGIEPEDLQVQIDSFGLDWDIVAVEGVPLGHDAILPFMADGSRYDAETDEVDLVPVVDITNKLQTWAGRAWAY